MPGGAVIAGKATGVESEALVVDVKKTSDRAAYPKGVVRVPRATLHRFEIETKGKVGRIVGTPLGLIVGAYVEALAALVIEGGLFNDDNPEAAATALIGITAAGTVGGYLLRQFGGQALDARRNPAVIVGRASAYTATASRA